MKRPHRWNVNLLSGRTAALWLLCGFFLTGSIVGCMVAGLFGSEDGAVLSERLEGYFTGFGQGEVCVRFLSVVWRAVRVPLAAFLLGLTALGVVGLPVLFAVRGFSLAYAVAVFYRLMGLRGLTLSACVFGVSALLWLPALLELGVSGLTGSYGLLRRVTGDGRYPLALDSGTYWLRCGLSAGAVLVCAGIEYMLVPVLIRLVA